MSKVKLAAACLASSATAAGVLLCALAAGKRSRPEAERIREDEEQMTSLKRHARTASASGGIARLPPLLGTCRDGSHGQDGGAC